MSKEGPQADAGDGHLGDLPEAKAEREQGKPSEIPVSFNNFKVEEPGQVWAADITYIPMREGFM